MYVCVCVFGWLAAQFSCCCSVRGVVSACVSGGPPPIEMPSGNSDGLCHLHTQLHGNMTIGATTTPEAKTDLSGGWFPILFSHRFFLHKPATGCLLVF